MPNKNLDTEGLRTQLPALAIEFCFQGVIAFLFDFDDEA
jgi:hypothetical protein